MATAKVFKSGNSQAVRLPKEFRFEASEVEILRRGHEVVLRERVADVQKAVEAMRELARLIELPADQPPAPVEPW